MIPALVVPPAAARAREGRRVNPRLEQRKLRSKKRSSGLFGIVNRRATRRMRRQLSAPALPTSRLSAASGMAGLFAARAAASQAMLRNPPRHKSAMTWRQADDRASSRQPDVCRTDMDRALPRSAPARPSSCRNWTGSPARSRMPEPSPMPSWRVASSWRSERASMIRPIRWAKCSSISWPPSPSSRPT